MLFLDIGRRPAGWVRRARVGGGVAEQQPPQSFGLRARRSADRLAVALEEVGFDVGRAFPMLAGCLDRHGGQEVELGRVSALVADGLSAVLTEAAQHGVATRAGGDWPETGPYTRHDPGEGH
jgi:hypothetical protein